MKKTETVVAWLTRCRSVLIAILLCGLLIAGWRFPFRTADEKTIAKQSEPPEAVASMPPLLPPEAAKATAYPAPQNVPEMPPVPIDEWHGRSAVTTDWFTCWTPWVIEWELQKDETVGQLQIWVYELDDADDWQLLTGVGAAENIGHSFVHSKGGMFYLHIQPLFASYAIRVWEKSAFFRRAQ